MNSYKGVENVKKVQLQTSRKEFEFFQVERKKEFLINEFSFATSKPNS